jgi:hypothetical protein
MSILLGLVELPSLCSCYSGCVTLAKYTKYVSAYWVPRALVSIGIAAGGFAIEVERRIGLEEVIVRADLNRSVTGIAHDDLDARATDIELDVALFNQHFARDHEGSFRSGKAVSRVVMRQRAQRPFVA